MFLKQLNISQFRNLQSVEFSLPEQGYCIISGPNGSGKTSLLEAIYTLSCGKSFRTADSMQLIQNDAENFVLFAKLEGATSSERGRPPVAPTLGNVSFNIITDPKSCKKSLVGAAGGRPFNPEIESQSLCVAQKNIIPIGIQRDRSGKIIAKCAGESAKFSEIARMLPTRVISPIESYTLINGGPEQRRRFLDWGMFHVKHFYWNELQKLNRILKQKNAALKMRCSNEELDQWNRMLAEVSYSLDSMRQEYMLKLMPIFSKYQQNLASIEQVNLAYSPGWNDLSTDLFTQLSTVARQERQQGHCVLGPHRAEILLQMPNGLCKDQLSRGRQKTLAIALYLAQGELLFNETGRHPLYMIDDFSSELDAEAQQLLINSLDPSDKQVILTTIDEKNLTLNNIYYKNQIVNRYTIEAGEIFKQAS